MVGKVVLSFILCHILGWDFSRYHPASLGWSLPGTRLLSRHQGLPARSLLGHQLEHGLLSPSAAVKRDGAERD